MVALIDPDHDNFDEFLGYVLDHYTAEMDQGPHDLSECIEHAAALQIEEVPPC